MPSSLSATVPASWYASPTMGAPREVHEGVVVVASYVNTRTWPEASPPASLRCAPTATVKPSALSATHLSYNRPGRLRIAFEVLADLLPLALLADLLPLLADKFPNLTGEMDELSSEDGEGDRA